MRLVRRGVIIPFLLCFLTGIPSWGAHCLSETAQSLQDAKRVELGITREQWGRLMDLHRRLKELRARGERSSDDAVMLSFRLATEARMLLIEYDAATLTLKPIPLPRELLASGISRQTYGEIRGLLERLKDDTLTRDDGILLRGSLAGLERDLMIKVDRTTGDITPLPLSFDIAAAGLPRSEVTRIAALVKATQDSRTSEDDLIYYRFVLKSLERQYPIRIDRVTGEISNR